MGLLGNERLKENLQASILRNRISHFYLISGPEGSGKHTLARLLSAALLCRGERKPCLCCNACRKVMTDNHPDVITVVDPKHKNIPVDMVRDKREEMFVRPNEADRKIYIFPQPLGIEGQNALLKVLEEPPPYGVFMLLTDNPEKLLPTVRSRCTELALQALPQELLQRHLQEKFPGESGETITAAALRSGGYLGQAVALLEEGAGIAPQTETFVHSYVSADALELVKLLTSMEKWKRDQLADILQQWLALLQNALACRSGMMALSPMAKDIAEARSSEDLLEGIRHLRKTLEYIQSNVSTAAICGYLGWTLR